MVIRPCARIVCWLDLIRTTNQAFPGRSQRERDLPGRQVKITAIETLRTEEFANVLWVRVHTDAGVIGLGETFYGAGRGRGASSTTRWPVRLLGRNPLHIEALHREMLEPADGAVVHRAPNTAPASAVDIALWDVFGKVCNQPVHQMLGGLCRDKQRIYNTCAGYSMCARTNIKPVSNWNLGESGGSL